MQKGEEPRTAHEQVDDERDVNFSNRLDITGRILSRNDVRVIDWRKEGKSRRDRQKKTEQRIDGMRQTGEFKNADMCADIKLVTVMRVVPVRKWDAHDTLLRWCTWT